MKIIVKIQSDKVGNKYLTDGEETIEIFHDKDFVYLEINGTLYEIPSKLLEK